MFFHLEEEMFLKGKKRKVMLDLVPFMTMALATNPTIAFDVKNAYKLNKNDAFKASKDSKYYNSPFLTDGSIERDILMREALGLTELCNQMNNDKIIEPLIKKGWKDLISSIESKEVFNLAEIAQEMVNKKESYDYFLGVNVVLIYYRYIKGKQIEPMSLIDDMFTRLYEFEKHYHNDSIKFSYAELKKDKEVLYKAKSIADRFLENFPQIKTTSDILDFWIEDEELSKHSRSLSFIFNSEKIMFDSMTDKALIPKKDIIELAAIYYSENKNQNREKSAQFILYGLYLKYVIKAYKDLKKEYFKNNKEEIEIEMKIKIDDMKKEQELLESSNMALKRQVELLTYENNKLKKEYKENIENENIQLKRENDKLKQDIDELMKEKEEFKNLSELLLSLKDDVNDIDDIKKDTSKIDLKKLKDKNIIILGGHTGWHIKLQEILGDDIVCIRGDNENFDENLLNSKDIVFMYTKFMSHGFFYKAIEKCKKLDLPVGYIKSTSPEYAIREMYDKVSYYGNN